jgi:hypothetical protein
MPEGIQIFIFVFWAHPAAARQDRALRSNSFCQAKAWQKLFRFNPLRVRKEPR